MTGLNKDNQNIKAILNLMIKMLNAQALDVSSEKNIFDAYLAFVKDYKSV